MRKILLLICAAACLVAASSIADAGRYREDGTYVGRPNAAVTSVFAQFPNGGPGLADAIAQLLINNPGLADDVAFVATNSGNAAQQVATGTGMAQAETVLRSRKEIGAAARIARAARESGNPTLIALAGGLGGPVGIGFANGIFLPSNNATTSNSSQNCTTTTTPGDNTVSPAIPPRSTTTCQ